MKRNLGRLDRVLRFALAFWWLGPWAPQYSIVGVNWVIAAIGWIALFESFFGWCWFHDTFGVDNKNQ